MSNQEISAEQSQAMTIIKNWKESADLRAEFQGDFSLYAAYSKAVDSGKVSICGHTSG